MSSFQEKIQAWSTKVVDYCHDVTLDPNMDLWYYAFQSEPKENPDLLILGINPSGDGKNTGVKDVDYFSHGNPCYNTRNEWKIWKELSKSFTDEKMATILDESMYMNILYFNTLSIKDFLRRPRGQEVFKQCCEYTVELITEIIKPKQILCLGTEGCFDRLPLSDKKAVIENTGLLKKGFLKEIPVYGIPHPSGYRNSNEEKTLIGQALKNEFEGIIRVDYAIQDSVPANVAKKGGDYRPELREVVLRIIEKPDVFMQKYDFLEVIPQDEKNVHLTFMTAYNDRLFLAISAQQEGYIAIKGLEEGTKIWKIPTLQFNEYTDILKYLNEHTKVIGPWLGQTSVKFLVDKSQDDIVQNLIDSIMNFVKEFRDAIDAFKLCDDIRNNY